MDKFGIRRKDLGEIVGGETVAERMIAAGWIEPIINEHKLQVFSYAGIAKAWARLERGEKLPKLKDGE